MVNVKVLITLSVAYLVLLATGQAFVIQIDNGFDDGQWTVNLADAKPPIPGPPSGAPPPPPPPPSGEMPPPPAPPSPPSGAPEVPSTR